MTQYYFPTGIVLPFDTACPTGWSVVSQWYDRFPKGSDNYGDMSGNIKHTHSVDEPSVLTLAGGEKGTKNCVGGNWKDYAEASHVHAFDRAAVVSSEADNLPPFIYVIFCKKL